MNRAPHKRHGPWRRALWTAALLALAARPLAAAEPATAPATAPALDVEKAEPAALQAFLRDYGAAAEQVRALVPGLGAETFADRRRAAQAIAALPLVPLGQLRAATQAPDPELRAQAATVSGRLAGRATDADGLLAAVLARLRRDPLPGLTPDLLALAVAIAGDEAMTGTVRTAFMALVQPADAALLRRTIAAGPAPARNLALRALARIGGGAAGVSVRPFLKDPDEATRQAAAEALLDLGDRAGLAVLVDLLESPDLARRQLAALTLGAVTGQQFAFAPAEAPGVRAAAVARWRAWLAADGKTAALQPVPLASQVLVGRTLICCQRDGRVIEVDPQGRIVWQTPAAGRQPWGAQALGAGRRLISFYRDKQVLEFDALNTVIWEWKDLPGGAASVERLADGNTLVACPDIGRVLEADRAGAVRWQAELEGRPLAATRLENGNTLVSLQGANRVAELDRAGKEVWAAAGFQAPQSAQRLPGGSTLVADHGGHRAVEVNREGQVLWEKVVTGHVWDAQRLPNGNTLIAEDGAVSEYAPDGQPVWSFPCEGASRARRY